MNWRLKAVTCRERGAALIIVLAFVVLLTGVTIAYLSRATSDRQVAHSSFNQSNVDQLAQSAMDSILGDLQQEIVNGSTATAEDDGTTVYIPTVPANMVPQRSGNLAEVPNLVRRSIRSDPLTGNPGVPSRASAVNSQDNPSVNGRSVTSTRWNGHYLVPKSDPNTDDPSPVPAFTGATPDWVFVTDQGASVNPPNTSVIGRYAYAIYDEGGLLDMNVAGYPTNTIPTQSGRKGSVAFADLTGLGNVSFPQTQVDKIVGWRNCASAQPNGIFPNFTFTAAQATNYVNSVLSNTNGFMTVSPNVWVSGSGGGNAAKRTDQTFVQRQELIALRKDTLFSPNALQYLNTFSRETNSPSFSPPLNASEMGGDDQGGTYAYRTNASSPTAINPNFLLRRVTTTFTRFDQTPAVVGEPLVKTRFPLSRLAWITYKGPSASLATSDPVYVALYQALTNAGLSQAAALATIQAGTAGNIKKCFGLVFGGHVGDPWTYTNPTGSSAVNRILRLDEVVDAGREPDFFELLQAGTLSGSLGQYTSTAGNPPGVTGVNVFPDIHMGSTIQHLLTIGACIIDQADPDSIPTRLQFTGTNGNTWAAYGVESLPYIAQIYPISGSSPAAPTTNWATYLLFQFWNPHIGAALSPAAPQVRIRVDGGMGIFTGGNARTWASDPLRQTMVATGQSIALTTGAFPPTGAPTPGPLGASVVPSIPAVGSASAPCGFERLPGSGANSLTNYIGLRLLPDYHLTAAVPGQQPPRLTLYLGTDATHQFNATMEYLVPGSSPAIWVPYNSFIGINDPSSWINGDTVPVRTSSNLTGLPVSADAFDNNAANRLTDPGPPACLMKADPRSTRFGIFQMDVNLDTTRARILQPLWPTNLPSTIPNGYGGNIADPGGPIEHAPLRFAASPYFPATLCINNAASTSTRTGYADNDGIFRYADAVYSDPSVTTTGSSTPYYTTSMVYHPIILNRPFRNVAELGYAFRDLPWKTLDFFTDKTADAGLLDIFTVNDGPPLVLGVNDIVGTAMPTVIAGQVNLNGTQPADLQSVLAGAIWDELDSTNIVAKTGTSATAAPVLAGHIVDATTATHMRNRSELVTRPGLPLQILPLPTTSQPNQTVKARREVVARATSSVFQTRTWNLLIDVIAQSGKYAPGETDLIKFVVEGEQHYWVHVAIDRFTGQVIDKQIEVVTE